MFDLKPEVFHPTEEVFIDPKDFVGPILKDIPLDEALKIDSLTKRVHDVMPSGLLPTERPVFVRNNLFWVPRMSRQGWHVDFITMLGLNRETLAEYTARVSGGFHIIFAYDSFSVSTDFFTEYPVEFFFDPEEYVDNGRLALDVPSFLSKLQSIPSGTFVKKKPDLIHSRGGNPYPSHFRRVLSFHDVVDPSGQSKVFDSINVIGCPEGREAYKAIMRP